MPIEAVGVPPAAPGLLRKLGPGLVTGAADCNKALCITSRSAGTELVHIHTGTIIGIGSSNLVAVGFFLI